MNAIDASNSDVAYQITNLKLLLAAIQQQLANNDITGYIEGCYGGPFLYPNCLLLAVGCSSKYMDLVMYVLGGFATGLVFGTIMCIKLLDPLELFALIFLAF